jgi:hypothetical protein
MFRKIIAGLTLACFIVSLQGCYHNRKIDLERLEEHPEYTITTVITVDGEVVEFEREGAKAAVLRDQEISGYSRDGRLRVIPLSQVRMIYVRKFDVAATVLLGIGVSALVFLAVVAIIIATKESCPFVYSFDGEKYVFDGEPYGGAICKALQRTDLCRLEHLNPVGGEYRLLLTNEVNETQHTDEFKLWVVDHPGEVDVIQDARCNLYTVDSLHKPLSVVDGRGENWSRWLCEKDLLFWESDVLSKDPDRTSDLRDTLLMTFAKPADAGTAKLVVCGCNTIWGSQMLRIMAELRGDQVKQWYEGYKVPLAKKQLDAWNKREEIYEIQIHVWANDTWTHRGEIMGGGPFMAEERVVSLDLEGVEGDTLKMLVAPPAGFWKLNSFAVDYSHDVPFEFQEISASSMAAHDEADLRDVLAATDGNYYVMPEVGQRAELTFPVPPSKPGLKRTVFAKVSGYYDMHLDASGPCQTDIIDRISIEPGYVVKFALEEYLKWRQQQLANVERED